MCKAFHLPDAGAALGLGLVVACAGAVDKPAPYIDAVIPSEVLAQLRTPAVIEGGGFLTHVKTAVDSSDPPTIDRTFVVRVGGIELAAADVSYVDEKSLEIVIPATLTEGTHDVEVTTPGNKSTTLAGGLMVIKGEVTTKICAEDSECDDTCRALFGCVDEQLCVIGPADKDADQDGYVDAACVGGDDCDDDPLACGAACNPSVATDHCDGSDNDCDGSVDEDHVTSTTSCGVGACAANTGLLTCVDGVSSDSCDPFAGAAADDTTCDAIDDDCDGSDDEDAVGPTTCGAGACAANTGLLTCVDGVASDSCDPLAGAAADDTTCDAIDDDCDGIDDEDYLVIDTCGVGYCQTHNTASSCTSGVETGCLPASPASEGPDGNATCGDTIDNDCDGSTDTADPDCGTVNTPPIPVLTITPPAAPAGKTLTGETSGTSDLEEPATSLTYEWNWDGDGLFETSGPTSSHLFAAQGSYLVVLRVTDSGGLSAWATFEVVIAALPDFIEVTTNQDEEDAGATPGAPGGSGLSLREAMLYADATSARQTIWVAANTVITLTDTLPSLADVDGVDIVGDGAVLDGSSLVGTRSCLVVDPPLNRFFGLEIRNCPGWAIKLNGSATDNQVARCHIHNNGNGVQWQGAGGVFGPDNEMAFNGASALVIGTQATVQWNQIHDNTNTDGIDLGSSGSLIVGNTIFRNRDGIFYSGGAVEVHHNTIEKNSGDGLRVSVGGTGMTLQNNIFSNNGAYGVDGDDVDFVQNDHNIYSGNSSGACSCATLGPGSLEIDPQYVSPGTDDYRLHAASQLVDAGAELGIDVNRPAPGLFNGSGPDIGASETP